MIPAIKIKDGVIINGAHFYPEMYLIIKIARETLPSTTDNCLWITSANDSGHKVNSLHYKNRAFDLRTRNLVESSSATSWRDSLAEKLGKDYDVILESDHIHVEFEPEEGTSNIVIQPSTLEVRVSILEEKVKELENRL